MIPREEINIFHQTFLMASVFVLLRAIETQIQLVREFALLSRQLERRMIYYTATI